MAKQRRVRRATSASTWSGRDDGQNIERTADSMTELAAASRAQAVRFVAAVARGMAKGIAGAARELRVPARDITRSMTETTHT